MNGIHTSDGFPIYMKGEREGRKNRGREYITY